MDCVIHEMLHARFPDLCEDAVDTFASTLSAVLYRKLMFREADAHED